MEALEHTSTGAIGGTVRQLEASSCQGREGLPGLDAAPQRREGLDLVREGEAGFLEVFHPGEETKVRPASLGAGADALRCQVTITTQRDLHLRIANHTARNIYVRLVGQQKSIAAALKDSVHLSPLEPVAPPADSDQHKPDPLGSSERSDLQPHHHVSSETANHRPQTPNPEDEEAEEEETSGELTISELVYSPCASMLPTPVEDGRGGVDQLFFSPAQSPARLLRELHADPDIQARLEAERELERERAHRRPGGALSGGFQFLSSNERVNACALSAARLAAVVVAVLLVAVPMLLLLLESDLDVSFLHEIRQTPEFEQFHHEYYCPLRLWVLCKVSMALENLWSD